MISIKNTTAKNFMNYEYLCFDFKEGFYNIIGKNRVGKSSIYETIVWCLYGTTVRGQGIKEVIKNDSTNTSVSVTISINKKEYVFTREISKSKHSLIYTVNNVLHDYHNVVLMQQDIINIIGMSSNVFIMNTLFGHNSFRFSKAKDSDRKNVLEEFIPEINEVRKLYEKCKNKDYLLDELNVNITTKTNTEEEIGRIKNEIRKIKDNKKDKIKNEVKTIKDTINSLDKKINNISNNIKSPDDKDVLLKRFDKLSMDKNTLLDLQKEYSEYVDYISNKNNTVCDKCGNELSTSRNKLLRIHKDKLQSITSNINNVDKMIKPIHEDLTMYERIQEIKDDIINNEAIIKELSKDTSNISKSSEIISLSYLVNKLNKKLLNLEQEQNKLRKQINIFEFWKKGFSNTGIISYIIDNYLHALNIEIAKVSENMVDALMWCEFSSYYTAKTNSNKTIDKIDLICYIDNKQYKYSALSNSERQRIDLIVMFAMKNINNTNIVFFDEVFEGLDDEASDLLQRYIKKRFVGKSCYIMSHMLNVKYSFNNKITVYRNKEKNSCIQL